MMSCMRSRLLGGLLASLLLAGCGDGASERASDPPKDRATSASTASVSSGLPSEADLATYFGAVASYDPDQLTEAAKIAALGSVAAEYVGYLHAFAESAIAGGDPAPAAEAEAVGGGYRACGGTGLPDECVVWGDLEGRDGKLVSFTINDRPVDPELTYLEKSPELEGSGGLLVHPLYAYRSIQSGTLFVLASVSAGRHTVEVDATSARYVVDRTELPGEDTRGPRLVAAGRTETVMFAFVNAAGLPLDGDVTFTVLSQGRDPEGVGFRIG